MLLVLREMTSPLSIALQQLQNSLVLHSLRIQLGVVGSLCCDRINVYVAQELGNVKFAFSNLLAGYQKVVSVGKRQDRL